MVEAAWLRIGEAKQEGPESWGGGARDGAGGTVGTELGGALAAQGGDQSVFE